MSSDALELPSLSKLGWGGRRRRRKGEQGERERVREGGGGGGGGGGESGREGGGGGREIMVYSHLNPCYIYLTCAVISIFSSSLSAQAMLC